MKAEDKNITSKNGITLKAGDTVHQEIVKPDNNVVKRRGVVIAINAETAKENVRVLFDDAIISLPALNADSLVGVEAEKPKIVLNEAGLRTDGPTLPEFIAAGYLAENYPPQGYTDKRTDAELAEALKAKNALAGSSAAQ